MAEDGPAYNHVRRIDKVKVRVVNVRVSDPGEFSTRAKVDTWAVAAATYNMQVIPHVPTVIAWLKSFPQTTSEWLTSLPRTSDCLTSCPQTSDVKAIGKRMGVR